MKIYNKKKRAESRVSYFSFLRWKEKKSSTFLLHLQFLRAYQASSREVKMKLRQFHSRFNWISECLKLIDDESDCNETRSSQLIIPKQGGAKKDLERHTMTSLKNCKTAINSLSLRVLHRRVLCCSRHSRPPRTIRMQLWFAHGTERRARASDDETKQQKIQLISQETVVEPYLWPFMTSTSDWKFHNSQTDSTTSDSKKKPYWNRALTERRTFIAAKVHVTSPSSFNGNSFFFCFKSQLMACSSCRSLLPCSRLPFIPISNWLKAL